ncbi:Clr5 domain-containing protein [Podospora appendiculata]|uniref:Clr5 domain-containing protein n=1 Tax=Podospora appendiculata TaxID=314037 RepID=A0AAE0WZ09_9PEZI|nr:Clr5 domain-containing protein [Podospora appendiculata]
MPPASDKVLDWDAHREAISELYWNRRKELQEVMEIMKATHGFIATKKQFKKQFKGWGLEKNIKTHEMKAMIVIQTKRQDEENKKTRFFVRDKMVPEGKLRRFQKRYKLVEIQAPDDAASASQQAYEMPPDIRYCTPDPEESTGRDFRSPTADSVCLSTACTEEEVYGNPENAQGVVANDYDPDLQVPYNQPEHQPYLDAQTSLTYWSNTSTTHHAAPPQPASDLMSRYSVPDDDSHLLSPNLYTDFTEHDPPLFSPAPSFDAVLPEAFYGVAFPGFFPSTRTTGSHLLFGGQATSYCHLDSAEPTFPEVCTEVEEPVYQHAYGAEIETSTWPSSGSGLMLQTPVTAFNYDTLDRSPRPALAVSEEDSMSKAKTTDAAAEATSSDRGVSYARCSCGMRCGRTQETEPDTTWR